MKIQIKVLLYIIIILNIVTIFSITAYAQDNNNNNNNNDTLFDDDDNDDDDDTLFDDDGDNEEGDNNDDDNLDIEDIEASIPKISYDKSIKLGFGSTLLLRDESVITDLLGEGSGIPVQQFYNTSAYGRFSLEINYMNFTLLGDAELLSTINIDNKPQIDFYINNFYVDYLSNLVNIRFGQFMVEWSNADLLKINNFFASPIIPELRPYSEYNQYSTKGVWAKLFINKANITLEGVLTPLPSFYVIPEQALIEIYAMESDAFKIVMEEDAPGFDLRNIEAGGRFGIVFAGVDLYLSYFHGYYKNSLLYTTTLIPPTDPATEPTQLVLTRIYDKVNAVGLDIAFSIAQKVSVRIEYNTMFNIPIIYEDATGTGMNTLTANETSFAYTIGFDLELFTNFRLLGEYSDIWFTGGYDTIDYSMYPQSKNIILTLKYSTTNNKYSPFLISAYNYELRAFNVSGGIETDFLNGFHMDFALSYTKQFYDKTDPNYGTLGIADNSFSIGINAYYQL